MASIGERKRLQRLGQHQTNSNTNNEDLNLDIDTSPTDTFRQQQEQTDTASEKIQSLLSSLLLNDQHINGNGKKIFHSYKGEDLPCQALRDKLEDHGCGEYIDTILEKYPQRETIVSLGNMTLKIIYYSINPESAAESAYIINEIRNGFKLLWIEYINKTIKSCKYKKDDIKQILQKNGIVIHDETNKLLTVSEMKKQMYGTFSIDMNVLRIEEPAAQNNAGSVQAHETKTQETEQQQQPQSDNTTQPQETQQTQQNNNVDEEYLTAELKKSAAKFKKVLRSEMMGNISKSRTMAQQIYDFTTDLQNQLDSCDFIAASHYKEIIDEIKAIALKLCELEDRKKVLYQAVPRRKTSRYVGRPEFITDLDKRIKQYNNEIGHILNRLHEVSSQTRSPMILAAASGPCYGLTETSKGILWISPVAQLASMTHCLEIQKIWKGFLTDVYPEKRSDLQTNYKYLTLKEKVKDLVCVAKQHKLTVILDKCKDLELGHLLWEIQEEGLEMKVNDTEIDFDQEQTNFEMDIEENSDQEQEDIDM